MTPRRKHIPGNIENRKQRPHQGAMFVDREERKKVLSELLQTEHLKHNTEKHPVRSDIEINGKRYVVLHGYNINEKYQQPSKDIKQRYAATLKLYKMVYNKITDKYYPNPIPYDIRIPSVIYFSHTEQEDVIVQEYIEGVTYHDLYFKYMDYKMSEEEFEPLAQFYDDRVQAIHELGGVIHDNYIGDTMIDIKIKDKVVRVQEDFKSKRNQCGDSMPPHGDNIICTKEDDKRTFWLTDPAMSSYLI